MRIRAPAANGRRAKCQQPGPARGRPVPSGAAVPWLSRRRGASQSAPRHEQHPRDCQRHQTGCRVIGLTTSENAARMLAGEGMTETYNIRLSSASALARTWLTSRAAFSATLAASARAPSARASAVAARCSAACASASARRPRPPGRARPPGRGSGPRRAPARSPRVRVASARSVRVSAARIAASFLSCTLLDRAAARATVEELRTARGCYRLELVRCGKCRRCERGPVHGPYWYWYGRVDGRSVSRYVGKKRRMLADELDSEPDQLDPAG